MKESEYPIFDFSKHAKGQASAAEQSTSSTETESALTSSSGHENLSEDCTGYRLLAPGQRLIGETLTATQLAKGNTAWTPRALALPKAARAQLLSRPTNRLAGLSYGDAKRRRAELWQIASEERRKVQELS